MSKHSRIWNQNTYEQRIKNGHGEGEGIEYKPWITVQDFSSHGTITRIKGWKTQRIHHFMSKSELQYFFLLEWAESVIDIREQYPLINVYETLEIAKSVGIKHPYDKKSGFPYVLTSDFLIMTTQGMIVRTIKMSNELSNKRVLEKLEIERRYWKDRDIDWKIVTEREINEQKAQNVDWLHSAKTLEGIPYEDVLINEMIFEILELYNHTDDSIVEICKYTDNIYNVQSGTGLVLFKYLAANKKVNFDMNERLNLNKCRSVNNRTAFEFGEEKYGDKC